MSELVDRTLTRITRAAGVQGAVVVDAEAGVSVASDLAPGVEETALAAMASSLFQRAGDASRSSGLGGPRLVQLRGTRGHVVVVGAGPLLVVALMEPDAHLGLVRVEAESAAEELRE